MSTSGVSSVSAYYQTNNLTQAELEEAIKKAKDAEEKTKAEAAAKRENAAKPVTVPLGSSAPEPIGDLANFTTKSVAQSEITQPQSQSTSETEPTIQEQLRAEYMKLTDEQRLQRVHKWAEDRKADENKLGEFANNPVMLEWRERTKGRADVETIYKELKSQGKSEEEIGEHFKALQKKYVEEDLAFLQEKFKQNPELRTQMQEHFGNFSRSEQKALLYEYYKSGRKETDKQEVERLMKGLTSASDEVKLVAARVVRPEVTDEQYKGFIDKLEIGAVKKLHEKSTTEQYIGADGVIRDKNSAARAELAKENPKLDEKIQVPVARKLINSEYIKDDVETKEAIAESLKDYKGKNQVEITKFAIDSDNFNSEDRDKVIKQFKNFEDKENQKTVANYVTDSDKVDENNRITMSKEIKNLHKDVQSDVAKHFSESEKNTQSEKVMEQFKKDINNLKIKEEEKAALQKRVQEAEAQRAAEAKKTAEAQAKAQEQARTEAEKIAKKEQEAKEKELKELEKMAKHASKGAQIQDAGLAQLVQSKMQKQTANPFFVQAQVRPTTFADLTNCINNGTLSFGEMQAAGYGNYAIACMNDLNMDKQDELIDSVDNKTIAYMHQKGLLPSRLNKQILARISSSTVDEHTARYAANQADSSNDIIAIYEAQKDSRNKEAISEVFQKRYSQSYEDYFKKKNGGFGTFSSLA